MAYDVEILGKLCMSISATFMEAGRDLRRRVSDLDGLGAVRVRNDGDTTHEFDIMVEKRVLQVLAEASLNVTVSSEESSDVVIGSGEDFLAIVDPVDGSALLARGYPLASCAFSLIDRRAGEPVLSVIYEVFTDALYTAWGGSAQRNGSDIRPSTVDDLANAFVVSYGPTRERRLSDAAQRVKQLPVSLVLNYGGPLDIAKVGSGQCEAVIENGKGFAARDAVPGIHIAMNAGAKMTRLDGVGLAGCFDRDDRIRFVVACNSTIMTSILAEIAD